MVREGFTPDRVLTEEAFHNAIRLIAALGGSTNAVLHLTAIAGRRGIRLPLDLYAELSGPVPLLANLQPSGRYGMDAFHRAGGLSAVIHELLPLLHGRCLTALGRTLEDVYCQPAMDKDVIAPLDRPFSAESGIKVLRGNLASNGAILKPSASSRTLWRHKGSAYVFDSYTQMMDEIDRDDLPVDASTILILRNCGPAAMGMPEWGEIPIPSKLLKQGVRDMVRISDARMSGTSYGTVVLHVSPEAAIGGCLAVVRNGDEIELDVEEGRLQLSVSDQEIVERLQGRIPPPQPHARGYAKLFADHVLQAEQGCDLDFMRPASPSEAKLVPPVIGRG